MRLFTGLLGALLIASGTTAQAQNVANDERVMFGPLWIGMSFDEARAAAPSIAWQEKRDRLNPARVSLEGPSAVEILEREFDVEVKPGVHGAARLDFHTAAGEIGLRECRTAMIDTVAELEGRFGAFTARPTVANHSGLADVLRKQSSDDLEMELPGFMSVSAGLPASEVISAGRTSRINFFASPNGQRGRGAWQSVRLPQGDDSLTVGVGASYGPDFDTRRSTCELYIFARHMPPRPEFETIAVEALDVVRTPTLGDRHDALRYMTAEQLAILPLEGAEVQVECSIRRANGTLLCSNPPNLTTERQHLVSAAQAVALAHRFSSARLQPESDIPLRTWLSVRLRASDRIDLAAIEGAPAAMNEVRWTQTPSSQWMQSQFEDQSAGDWTFRSRCQIQSDGSLACGDIVIERDGIVTNSMQQGFFAQRMISVLLAAPVLTDGSPSTGRLLDYVFTVRIAQDG